MNTDDPELAILRAERRVREIQTKLHRWATSDPRRVFDDLHNLVYDPAFLLVAWGRVRGNKGSRTAGVDGETVHYVEGVRGVEGFLSGIAAEVKARSFQPVPVRERMIPKPGTNKRRRLGIPTVRDRVVQAALKLVLEPIFEADFRPCSYGFRPNRRAQDAIAETRMFTTKGYEWIVEGDIKACFDEISHPALMDRVRVRIVDKRILALVKAFLKSGLLTEAGQVVETGTGTPQGGILSPLLANIALSVLDDHIAEKPGGPSSSGWERSKRRRAGLANFRLIRYADDWLLLVIGTRHHAEALKEEIAEVLSGMGLRLSPEKTSITHIDDGVDFLGWRIQRHRKKGTNKRYVYTYPARKAVRSICAKVKAWCRQNQNLDLSTLILRINRMAKGWCVYFRPGVSYKTFAYLSSYIWRRVILWIRGKHARIGWKELRRRFCAGTWWPRTDKITLFDPVKVRTTRYRYRGTKIPSPWPMTG
ncbi:group II intron reverse transcriptase/maturase [Micromonospora sp. CNB394]|uniref:group II intron reverse transcriptase/maturase n=1 Tax=Micromonospora sp. CNB394 TaxID=1169151 RepID=UPI0003A38BCD|nr:group II intron reverse transcriptase/maturase [Micromonospora sp. CNB394]